LTDVGFAVKVVTVGSVRVAMLTVAVAVTDPFTPVAVMVYTVVVVGLTCTVPTSATLPTPWSMLTEVALADCHVSVTLSPELIVVGVALKITVGASAGGTGEGEGVVIPPQPKSVRTIPSASTNESDRLPYNTEDFAM
jgi:hypothetical protein